MAQADENGKITYRIFVTPIQSQILEALADFEGRSVPQTLHQLVKEAIEQRWFLENRGHIIKSIETGEKSLVSKSGK